MVASPPPPAHLTGSRPWTAGDGVWRPRGKPHCRLSAVVAVVWCMVAVPLRGQAVMAGSRAQAGPVESPAALNRQGAPPPGGAWPVSGAQRAMNAAFAELADSARIARAPWWAPVASALLPGAGQFALGQQRSVGYVVAEAYLLLQALGARRDGHRQRDAYRELAASVARRRFGEPLPIGTWDYYESMEKFLESGGYDRIPGGAVDPELDESTFNGARWLLARQIYWRDPREAPPLASQEYQRALAFYQARAVREGFQWSWRDAQLEQDLYRQTIAEANRSYQRAVTLTGVVWMNHLASLIDAYVSWRIRRFGGAGVAGLTVESVRIQALPQPPHLGGGLVFGGYLRLVPGQGGR
jgi:hypothetical protein